ncbi:MAG: histidine kinase [Gammaproteobacteria bacterium BRH_c0]|nr:MAG: histidine kinase [Gammaproteobacteria bacterium BRH_c0]
MTKYLASAFIILFHSQALHAGIIQYFKEEDGSTNWQYIANFSSSMLILLLSIALIKLFFTIRQVRRSNRALKAIRNDLEIRVKERTATLNESNQLLKQTNQLLETEVKEHRETTSRLRASEAYIKNILESMPLMLVGIREDGEITQWNKRAEEIAGIPTAQALGKNLWKTYPAITVAPDQIAQALADGKPVTIKHSQRGRYHFDIIIYPLKDQMEAGAVILIDDVTQRVATENMLIQRDKMSSLGELASNMAHDINTPLQTILDDMSHVRDCLKNDILPGNGEVLGKLNSLLDDASEKGKQASAVITNLLSFAGAQGNEKKPEDVTAIIEHSLTLAADVISVPGKLRFRDIAIERDFDPALRKVPCNRSELQQVFLSLFRHACHALSNSRNPEQQPVIHLEMKEHYDALWIKISHNGQGLTYDEQKYIFEPFFNSPDDNKYDASKRLSFSYFIITEHHKGQMAVTSDVNVGTTFHMQIQLQ